ncbi:MAG: transglutaminase domain-containing protein [Phycisphaerales bacterium]|nr:transglutaminase domain-containing protein [Planctomycetota bacterium]MBL6997942.1 transglutaminase domain-containing protein [Phycisphaerales bacterium]
MNLTTSQKNTRHRPLPRGRFIFVLSGLIALGMIAPQVPTDDPPSPPLTHGDARIYEIRVNAHNALRSNGWPLLPRTNWCKVDLSTLLVSTPETKNVEFRVESLQDQRQWKLLIPEQSYTIRFNAMSFASKLNDRQASSIPWPESWDKSVALYLEPSRFIESEQDIFKQAVQENGNPKSTSVHTAAKVLIRYCLKFIKSDGQYANFTNSSTPLTTGIKIKGALRAVQDGKGSATDVVCVCVATLRSAGIPARPVVGITNVDIVGTKNVAPYYMVWGEYALPDVGWVPFVPKRMRGTVKNLSLDEPWQGLGTLPWLNRRIPLTYNFNCYDVDKAYQSIQMQLVSTLPE